MKASTFYRMEVGDSLWLKSKRAKAYGKPRGPLTFERVSERPGYETPWIVASGGVYAPSDFDKWEARAALASLEATH